MAFRYLETCRQSIDHNSPHPPSPFPALISFRGTLSVPVLFATLAFFVRVRAIALAIPVLASTADSIFLQTAHER